MRTICTLALVLIVGVAVAQEPKKLTTLPGVMTDGRVQLPNSWSIKPAGKQIELGDFPISIALHRRQMGWCFVR